MARKAQNKEKFITRTIERTFAKVACFNTETESKEERVFPLWGKFEEEYEIIEAVLNTVGGFIPYKVVSKTYEAKKYKISVTDFVAFGTPADDDDEE